MIWYSSGFIGKSNISFGLVAQLNRASDYGSEGLRFESLRGHKNIQKPHSIYVWGFFIVHTLGGLL